MADYEIENAIVKETLAQVQGEMNLFWGNMETILKYLQTQRVATSSNPASANVTSAAMVTTTANVVATVETPVETVVSTAMNQHMFTSTSNRLVASYPWGIPPKFAS